MTAVDDRVLSQDELRALSHRSDLPGFVRLATHLLLLCLAGWGMASAEDWLVWPAMLALGLVQAALFAPAHETMHQTAFAATRANLIVGWLASLPSLQPSHYYAAFHYLHHRHTNVPGEDPELLTPPPVTLGQYATRILGLRYWTGRLRLIADAWRGDLSAYPFINARQRPGVMLSVRAMSLTVAATALLVGLLWGWRAPLLFWIGPQLLGQPFLRAYLLAEHTGCMLDRNGLTNTRTTLTNRLVRLLMWDMPFHAEHHLYPSIPFHRLADAHRLIGARLRFLQPGYANWNAGFIRALVRQ